MVLILVASDGLDLHFANAPLTGARGLFEGIAIYFVPGLVGAWIAVEIVRQVEVRALKTQARREFATRTIIALIVFGPVFIVCTGVQFNMFSKADAWWPAFLVVSFTAAVFASALTFLLVRTLQQRTHGEPR
jgi:protein-S-isoprenylcysteine O-methyltransferase Ste14